MRAIKSSPICVLGATSQAGKASPPQPAASAASELSMAGLMPAGRSRSLGGFDVPKEPTPPKQARLVRHPTLEDAYQHLTTLNPV